MERILVWEGKLRETVKEFLYGNSSVAIKRDEFKVEKQKIVWVTVGRLPRNSFNEEMSLFKGRKMVSDLEQKSIRQAFKNSVGPVLPCPDICMVFEWIMNGLKRNQQKIQAPPQTPPRCPHHSPDFQKPLNNREKLGHFSASHKKISHFHIKFRS